MKLTNHLSRVIEDHLWNLSSYQKLIENDIGLGKMGRSLYRQSIRLHELKRITEAIEKTFNELQEDQKLFIQSLYFENRKPTIQAASDQVIQSRSTGNRIKKKFIQDIAIELGWI